MSKKKGAGGGVRCVNADVPCESLGYTDQWTRVKLVGKTAVTVRAARRAEETSHLYLAESLREGSVFVVQKDDNPDDPHRFRVMQCTRTLHVVEEDHTGLGADRFTQGEQVITGRYLEWHDQVRGLYYVDNTQVEVNFYTVLTGPLEVEVIDDECRRSERNSRRWVPKLIRLLPSALPTCNTISAASARPRPR